MDKRDLAIDQSTHEDIVAVTDGSRHREDLVTFWMRPPAPANGRSRCDCGKRWHGPARGLEHDTVPADESQGPARSHQWTRSGGASNFTSRWWASVLRHKSVARCSSRRCSASLYASIISSIRARCSAVRIGSMGFSRSAYLGRVRWTVPDCTASIGGWGDTGSFCVPETPQSSPRLQSLSR
jgi:hypothetical protein